MKNPVRFLVPALLLVVVGCGHHEEGAVTSKESPAKSSTSGAEPTAYTNEKGELFCPVMKTVIASKEAAVGHQDYEGKRYYFCCGMCPDKFKENPALYAKK
ncbi:MAG: YHS domain-containing protein [Fimbriimonadaceae bacterium]|nr:YHS domain-containing protein [Fimbriimonadaceae bacterium]